MSFLDQLRDSAGRVASAAAGSVRVRVKTNLGPAFTLYDGAAPDSGGLSLSRALGVKASVWVETQNGQVLYESGPAPATDPLRAAGLIAVLAVAGYLVVRALRR